MSICDSCIHDNVCGLEDNHEEGIISCADRIPKYVLDKIIGIDDSKTLRVRDRLIEEMGRTLGENE